MEARQLAKLFRVAVTSISRRLSTKATKGEKCRSCWRHASRYIRFFPLSASCRQLSGSFVLCVGASVFTTHMFWKLSVSCCQSSRISRPPYCSVTSGGGTTAWSLITLALSCVDFVLFTARPEYMRGLSRTWEGVKA